MLGIIEKKRAMREQALRLRRALSPEHRLAASHAICCTVAAHPAFLEADLILSFFAVRGEVDLSALLSVAHQRQIPVAYPVCVGKELIFRIIKSEDNLLPDAFGIPAPRPDLPLAHPTERTLCLLPGLAAGRDGTRLGYGGGFYDRFLDTFEGITLFPIYEELVFDTLPQEPTDRPVDIILTEKGEIPHA